MVSLSEMPDVVMNIILDKVGFRGIMTLRKVCHDFRNFIDLNIPEAYLDAVDLQISIDSVFIHLFSNPEYEQIYYKKHEKGCLVTCQEKEKLVENIDFVPLFFKDFNILLKHQKSLISGFHTFNDCTKDKDTAIEFSNSLKKLLEIQKLKVRYLNLGAVDQQEFMSILPFVDPSFLKIINFHTTSFKSMQLDLHAISKLDQWKNAEKLKLRNFFITSGARHLEHFSNIHAPFEKFSGDDVFLLKEAAIHNPKFESYHIEFQTFENKDQLFHYFGLPYFPLESSGENKKRWFFLIPNKKKILEIVFYQVFKTIYYNLIDLADLPPNARLQEVSGK